MASGATRAFLSRIDDIDDLGIDDRRGHASNRPARRKRDREWHLERPPLRADKRQRGLAAPRRGPTRAARTGAERFKCGHCRAFIGPTIGGGRHRNHCPLCLYSRHVDGARPGDRAGGCRSLMAPVARFYRPNGEPVLVHRCLGCGFERHNRLASDDNVALLTRLPLVAPRSGRDEPSTGARRDRRAS